RFVTTFGIHVFQNMENSSPRSDYYATRHPKPEDIYLLIEVADSSINFDREIKVPLYASAGIKEVWLIDLNENCLEVYRNPLRDRFAYIQILQSDLNISSLAFPEINFSVSELL
ncbi:MAG: Uma2 family endonuclease, partial [Halothece sp.]